jgi:hypothetical protein
MSADQTGLAVSNLEDVRGGLGEASSLRRKSAERRVSARSPSSPSPQRVTRLKTLDDVRVELAKVYREARTGTLPLTDAKALAYLLSVVSALVKDNALEERILVLEQQLKTTT